jgi:tight adherence protein B
VTAADTRRRLRDLGRGSPEPPSTPTAVRPWATIAIRLAAFGSVALGMRGSEDADHAMLLEAVARSLRGGSSLAHALEEGAEAVSPCRAADELRAALSLHERGAPVLATIEAWSGATPTPARTVAGAALALGSELGGARARALDGAAATLRDRGELLREVRALTSQARSSAAVLALAPIGFALLAWTTDHRLAAVMLTTPFGWACLVGGLALDGLGAWWMARLTARVT